ncbi:pyridoxine 5'-phosphate synthase [bacterium]|nr:pyridoxine 5'-phosphate synthase [bacterium]
MLLGVNIDHVATLRQQRKQGDPDLIAAARVVLAAGADGITVHLREDRRHIQDQDVVDLRRIVPRLNLEMAATDEMIGFALNVRPDFVCLVPEKREELTTEGGLDVLRNENRIKACVDRLQVAGIDVSLFIDAEIPQIQAAHRTEATYIEVHTGLYAEDRTSNVPLKSIKAAASYAKMLGLRVNAGHGLNYDNVAEIVRIPEIEELNIGHSIVSRALTVGLESAVREMKSRLIIGSHVG